MRLKSVCMVPINFQYRFFDIFRLKSMNAFKRDMLFVFCQLNSRWVQGTKDFGYIQFNLSKLAFVNTYILSIKRDFVLSFSLIFD